VLDPVIGAAWLCRHRDEVVTADVRWYVEGRSGEDAYLAGHIPGAVFLDLEIALSRHDDPRAGRHPLPTPEAFADAMSAAGIGDETTVVAYDDAGGVTAARLVWMLRVLDRSAALLDGGLAAWPGPLETGPIASPDPARFSVRAWPASRLASIDDAAAPGGAILIDARQRERFAGAADALDPRAGHIPGARSVPCRENLAADGRLLAVRELRRRFANAGITDASAVISYCGSGVTACHNLLAMEHAGLGRGRLYPGSWSEWSRDKSRPDAVGSDEPGQPSRP
jgi:thiosulfate/3-mercaptopyruvate sulfurtransferase